jgi:hypothetical protein
VRIAMVSAGLVAWSAVLTAQESAAVRFARITYLTPRSAYLDAGRVEGLREGAQVEVVRGGTTIAVLKVTFLASHRSSCEIVSSTSALVIGDAARFAPAPGPPDTAIATAPQDTAPKPVPRSPAARLRGRVGINYFAVQQESGAGSLAEPALQLRLDGPVPGTSHLHVVTDVRARRTHTVLADGSTVSAGRNRVYQAALTYRAPHSPLRVVAGRQISNHLASVGLFDGLRGELTGARWSGGVFVGSQPEPLQLGWSGSIVQAGGYAQRHSPPGGATRWALTFGMAGSYDEGHVNREFLFLQAHIARPRFNALLAQELDYYRSWKRLDGMDPVSPTSTFALLRYQVARRLTVEGGFDNRRNVRLYRDVTNPAIAFDDAHRQGAWAGIAYEPTRRLRFGFDGRASSGGGAGHASAYTFSLTADRLAGIDATLRARSTRFTNPSSSGWLHAGSLSLEPDSRVRLELHGGLRHESDSLADPSNVAISWAGADVDITLAGSWYFMISGTRQRGGVDSYDELFTGLSLRF